MLNEFLSGNIDDCTTQNIIFNENQSIKFNKIEAEVTRINIFLNFENCLMMAIKDLTKIHKENRKKIEKRYENLLISSLTHEVRTPLNCIVGSSELLIQFLDKLPQNIQDLIKRIHRQSMILVDTVDNIQEYFTLKSETKINCTLFNPAEEIKNILDLYQEDIITKKLEYSVEFDASIPFSFISDFKKFRQIFISILSNSIKYTFKGGISITTRYDAIYSLLKVSIKDTGIGIKPEKLEKIFTIFSKIDEKDLNSANLIGTGMGLCLSKTFCEALGGSINIKSKVNMGTQVTFEIKNFPENYPRQLTRIFTMKKPDSPSLKKASTLRENFSPKKRKSGIIKFNKILIVDDTESNLFVIKSYAEKLGLDSDLAYNGQEALDKVINSLKTNMLYKLIVLDINMPILDGISASKMIRDLDDRCNPSNLPIIALTANTNEDIAIECKNAEMNEILNKPITFKYFKEIMELYLNQNYEQIIN